jgi:hypothetical protein
MGLSVGAKGRWLRVAMMIAAVGIALVLARGWPKERTVRYVLGDRARGIDALEARWAPEGQEDNADELRTVSFRFGADQAPRVVTQAIRLPDGIYDVEIILVSAGRRTLFRRRVPVGEGPPGLSALRTGDEPVSIDLAAGLPPAHDVTLEPRPTGPR